MRRVTKHNNQNKYPHLMAAALFASLALSLGLGVPQAQAAPDEEPLDARPLQIPMSPMRGMTLEQPDEMFDDVKRDPFGDPISTQAVPNATAVSPAPMTAQLPPAQTAILRVIFADGDAVLSDKAVSDLNAFAYSFKERGGRVALKGYAGAPGDSSSNMRRLSLKRVLAVRDALLAHGISADRFDVRALGGVQDSGKQNRVDIVKSGG